jgi:hypothetical protein
VSLSEDDLKQFRQWIDRAIIRTEEVVENFSDEKLLRSVRQQLDFLFRITRNGQSPSPAELRRFAIGLTARRLEEVDDELSRLFARFSNYLESDRYPT